MNILFTADLHLNISSRSPRTGRTAFDVFAEMVEMEGPDIVVVAGDIGTPAQASAHIKAIRKVVGDRVLAIALGNHDFWLGSTGHEQFSNLDQVVTRFWREPARDVGALLLDRENAVLGDFAITGGYGHFDLGLAEPDLRVRGKLVTEDIYLSGGMGGLFWNDFRFIPNCGTRVRAEAKEQAEGIAARMDEAIASGKQLLVAVHTCPWRELNGHPLRGDESDILSAYSGNSLVGKEIQNCAASIDFLMCGHTHMPVREISLHGIPCLNVGADYGRFRGVIYETGSKTIRWIGEPVSFHSNM
jgi:predicted phosphodiesterase